MISLKHICIHPVYVSFLTCLAGYMMKVCLFAVTFRQKLNDQINYSPKMISDGVNVFESMTKTLKIDMSSVIDRREIDLVFMPGVSIQISSLKSHYPSIRPNSIKFPVKPLYVDDCGII